MIKPKCDHCGRELMTYGGLAFSPPAELSDGSADPNVKKKHICADCWKEFEEWLMCPHNSFLTLMIICADLIAMDKSAGTPTAIPEGDWNGLVGRARKAITYQGGGTFKP
jgi:hypothetical protein